MRQSFLVKMELMEHLVKTMEQSPEQFTQMIANVIVKMDISVIIVKQ